MDVSSFGTWAEQLPLPGFRAQAQWLWCTGLVVPRHVESSWIRERTCVSCIGRWILCPWASSEAPTSVFIGHFLFFLKWLLAVQSLSRVWLFVTPWTAACQASLAFTISLRLLKFMSTESVMPSNQLILCHPLLLSILPSIQGLFQWVGSSHQGARVLETFSIGLFATLTTYQNPICIIDINVYLIINVIDIS